jgi:hypothetical protein
MYVDIHVKHLQFLSDFKETGISLDRFSKSPETSTFMKIPGRTDGHDEADSRFSQFCEGA